MTLDHFLNVAFPAACREMPFKIFRNLDPELTWLRTKPLGSARWMCHCPITAVYSCRKFSCDPDLWSVAWWEAGEYLGLAEDDRTTIFACADEWRTHPNFSEEIRAKLFAAVEEASA